MQALCGPHRRGQAWKVVNLEAVGGGGDPRRPAGRPRFHSACTCVCARVHARLIVTIHSQQLVLTKQAGLKRGLSLFLLSNLCQC